MHVSDDGTADEDILDGAKMRVLQLLDNRNVIELDVEVLVDALEHAADLDVVFELDGDLTVDERLEKAKEKHLVPFY